MRFPFDLAELVADLVLFCTEEYVASFKPELMDAVYSWCNGAKFSEICKASWSRSLLLAKLTVSSSLADDGRFRGISHSRFPPVTRADSPDVDGYVVC